MEERTMNNKLSIAELAELLSDKQDMKRRDALDFVTTIFELVKEGVERDKLVKVKGLGTFKVIDVDARESINVNTGERVLIDSHSKITFTPDASMKELVNKPFSSFETVPLNDGVEFPDMSSDEEKEEKDEPSVADVPAPVVVAEEPAPEVKEEPAPVVEEEPAPEVEEEPAPEVKEEPAPEVKEEPIVEFVDDEPVAETHTPWWKWVMVGLTCLLLGFVAGYYSGQNNIFSHIPDSESETVETVDSLQAIAVDSLTTDSTQVDSTQVDTLQTATAVPETTQAEPKTLPGNAEPDYDAMDDRVRLGAYRITGLADEVTVQPGQTFRGICKAYLGDGMECYVEVYNGLPRNPQLKAGQVIKIPKVEWKRKR